MNPALVALAALVVASGVLAVAARDGGLTAIGLLAVLALSPLVADPLPGWPAAGVRIVAATLAAYLIAIPVRSAALTRGSRIGWPAETLAAAAGFIGGLAAASGAGTGGGPAAAVGAGLALAVLAVAPLAETRDLLRQGVGLLLVVVAAELVRAGLAGTPGAFEALVLAGVVVALGAAIALLATRALAAAGDLEARGAEPHDR